MGLVFGMGVGWEGQREKFGRLSPSRGPWVRASTNEWTPLTLPLPSSPGSHSVECLTTYIVGEQHLHEVGANIHHKTACAGNSLNIVPKHFESKKKKSTEESIKQSV